MSIGSDLMVLGGTPVGAESMDVDEGAGWQCVFIHGCTTTSEALPPPLASPLIRSSMSRANGEEEIGAGALSEEDQDRDKLVQPSKVQASPGSHRNSTNLASAGRRTS